MRNFQKYVSCKQLFIFLLFFCGTAYSQGIMFPMYIDPTPTAIQPLLDAKAKYPKLALRIILNPDNGVGRKRDPDYVTAIHTLKQAGISVVGYIATNYQMRPIKDVKKEIAKWMLWYEPQGLFFDEMSDNHHYYRRLSAYAKKVGIHYVVGNPGTDVSVEMGKDIDTANVFEDGSLPNLALYSAWARAGYPPEKISMLSHSIASYPAQFVAESGATFGWIFITPDTLPNPWDSYPSYFSQLVDQVATCWQ